jgi:hypothetical protein
VSNHGKWSEPGVPHKGWTCVDVDDNGCEPDDEWTICEMCEVVEIRWVHRMTHPDYPDELGVGCICAEHMEDDYVGPKLREQRAQSRARRRQGWGRRQWYRAPGHEYDGNWWYLNSDGYHLDVWRDGTGWLVCVTNRASQRSQRGKREYPTREIAQAKALDALLWGKDHLT